VAKRARDQLIADIAEHIGPQHDDSEAASLFACAIALQLGDLIQRAGSPDQCADLVNALWRYSRWPLRLEIERMQ
jgi:hypothetical protein